MIEKYQEVELANQLSLPRGKRVPTGFNFGCPFCNEGHSHGKKRRAYLLINSPKHDHIRFYCHNCNLDLSFRSFLERFNITIFDEYREKEKRHFLDRLKGKKKVKNAIIQKSTGEFERLVLDKEVFRPVAFHQKAVSYCRQRKIPKGVVDRLFYVPADIEIPTIFEPLRDMVVFPFYAADKIYGYQGRSISKKLFHTHSQPGLKIYNIFNVKLGQNVYCFESIIDSFYIDNSIAMVGSGLGAEQREKLSQVTFVLDNDNSDDLYRKLEKLVNNGERVVIWPDEVKEKDVNEMVVRGWNLKEINRMIDERTFFGPMAKIKLGMKRMKKRRR